MPQPTDYSTTHEPLVAFREETPGVYTFDPDLDVSEVHLASSGKLHTAQARLYTGEVRSAISGQAPVRTELTRDEIERRYPPYVRFAIGLEATSVALRDYLLVGYVDKPTVKFGAAGGDPPTAFWNEVLRFESQLGREAQVPGRTLQGQYRMSEALALALGDTWWDFDTFDPIVVGEGDLEDVDQPIKLVQSERLCFNPGARPNRLRRPIRMTYPGRFAEEDVAVDVFAFTDPDSPQAELWTYHQVLQYLWYVAMRDAAVRAGNLFDASDPINIGPGGIATHLVAPAEVETEPPGWLKAMVRYCATFTPEGQTILEALQLLHTLCGLRFREELGNDAGEPVSRMVFWVPSATQQVEMLELEQDGTPTNSAGVMRDVETDVLRRNNASHARILKDWSAVRNRVRVIGDRQYLVMRLDLSPLWTPHMFVPPWDNITLDHDAFVTDACQDDYTVRPGSPFYRRHHPDGDLFGNGENMIVGRLYGMDFAAELDPAEYDRDEPPYDNYGYVIWSALGTWTGGGAPPDQVRRRRRIMPLTAEDAGGQSVGVVLEVSWDGAEHWYRVSTGFKVIPERSAILLIQKDLMGFGSDVLKAIKAEEQSKPVTNYYHAYITRVFRLRVTALVEMDERVVGDVRDPWSVLGVSGPLGPLSASQTVLCTDDFRFVDSERFASHGYVGEGDVDDTSLAADFAWGALQPRLAPRVSAVPSIPWHDTEPRYALGTPIGGVRRSPLNSDADLSFTAWLGPAGLCPEVIGKIFRQSREGASTELVLEQYTYARSYA